MSQISSSPSRDDFLSTLFRSDYKWLVDRLRFRIGNVFGAEDVAAEAFTQLVAVPDVTATREPRALLTTIAQRLMYDAWRRRDLEAAYLEARAHLPEAMQPSPEERALRIEALIAIDRALDTLPPKARQAFLYSQLDGLTYAEIGERLNVSASMVRQYMAKALACCYLAAG